VAGKAVKLIGWLRLPETRNISDLDAPETTLLHSRIIQQKAFLKNIYTDFYQQFKRAVTDSEEKVLVEIGSGGGFINEVIPSVITSDVLELPNVDQVFAAGDMPFDDGSVDAFFMFDVLHHIGDPGAFFTEALRRLKVGGKVVMIEPANTLWARFVYRNLHHEEFDPEAGWHLEKAGPVSQGNGALPWIIFVRDRTLFEQKFPTLRVVGMRNHTPLRYLLSGGLTLRQLVPSFTYPLVRAVESLLSPLNDWLGMVQTIELEKTA